MLPAFGFAQERSASPIVVVGEGAATQKPAATTMTPAQFIDNYPKAAITEVGGPAPAPAPANAPAPATPESPANPASPTPPASTVNKLWPRDTVAAFLPPCTSLRPQFVEPCACVITKLMVVMPHDEFLKKSEDGTLEQDARLKQIQLDCVTAVKKKE